MKDEKVGAAGRFLIAQKVARRTVFWDDRWRDLDLEMSEGVEHPSIRAIFLGTAQKVARGGKVGKVWAA